MRQTDRQTAQTESQTDRQQGDRHADWLVTTLFLTDTPSQTDRHTGRQADSRETDWLVTTLFWTDTPSRELGSGCPRHLLSQSHIHTPENTRNNEEGLITHDKSINPPKKNLKSTDNTNENLAKKH